MPIFEKCHLPIEVSGSTTEHAIKNETWTFSNSKKYEITKDFFFQTTELQKRFQKLLSSYLLNFHFTSKNVLV